MMAMGDELADRPGPPGGGRWAPLIPLVVAVALGIIVDRYLTPWGTSTWVALAVGAGAAALMGTNRELAGSLAVVAAFGALGGGWHHARWWDREPDDLGASVDETPRPAWIRGVVREALGVRPDGPDRYGATSGPGEDGTDPSRTRFVVDLTAIHDGREWRPVSGRAMAIVAGDRSDVIGGEAIEAIGQLAAIAGPLNPGEFDYRQFLHGQGIDLRFTVNDPEGLRRDPGGAGSVFGRWLGTVRAWSRERLVGGMDPRVEPLAAALLLGRREGVDPEVNDAFARTGTTHLLAISGMQMQMLAGALLIVTRLLGLPRRPAFLGVALATAAYAVLVGPAPSIVRSTVMTVTFCLAAVAGRMTRPANILALAALLTLAVNPAYLFDVGCQLSFLAIVALVWLVSPVSEAIGRVVGAIRDQMLGPRSPLDELERKLEPSWKKQVRKGAAWVVFGVVTSTVVWLAALPLVALRFHIVSPIGILLNIPLIPITSAAMLLGGLGMGLSAAWGPLGVPASRAAGVLLDVTRRIVLWGAAQPWGHRFVAGPGWAWVVVFYLLLGLAAVAATASRRRARAIAEAPQASDDVPSTGRLRRHGPWWLLAAWSAIGGILAVVPDPPRTPEADVLAVGHGLTVVIQTPGGRTLVYDCGRMGDPSVGRRIIAPALWARGLSRIDEVILSHADQDHYNGLPDLLGRFAIGVVRVPPGFGGPANPAADRLIAQVRSRGIPVRTTEAPESWDAGGVGIAVEHPPAGWPLEVSDNARSLVLDVAHGGRHLLLTGDLEQIGLVELIGRPRPEPPPDVLLSPHHGGRSANPVALFDWASPGAVVVSQRPPRGGSSDALAVVEQRSIPLWRTWRDGAIRLRWTADGIAASGFLGPGDHRGGSVAGSRTEPRASASSPRAGGGIHHSLTVAARSTDGPTGGGGAHRSLTVAARSGSGGPWPLAVVAVGPWLVSSRLIVGLAGFAIGAILWTVLAIVEFGAWTLVVPPRADPKRRRDGEGDLAPPGPAPVPEWIEARADDGVRLAGRWYPAPGANRPARVVLLLHGFAEDPSVWEGARASILNRHGWDVAALESRGYGRSGGMLASFGGREAGDVVAWLDAIAGRLGGPDATAALWGRSMGAAIAMRAAVADRRVAALVLESPMVDLDASVATLLRKRGLRFTRVLAGLITRRAGRIAGVPLRRPRPLDVAPRVGCRTLIVHGADDWLVPQADVRRLADAFPAPPRRVEVPRAGHSNVVGTGGQELVGQIAEFLDGIAEDVASAPLAVSDTARCYNESGQKTGVNAMATTELVHIEAAIDQLPFSDQLWLMERLARRLRERSLQSQGSPERELEEMANDPDIQRELREIEAEFAITEADGLDAHR
jgi:competence protein ComEC